MDSHISLRPHSRAAQNSEAAWWRLGASGLITGFKFGLFALSAMTFFKYPFELLFHHRYNEDKNPDLLSCVCELMRVNSQVESSEQSELEEMMARVDSLCVIIVASLK